MGSSHIIIVMVSSIFRIKLDLLKNTYFQNLMKLCMKVGWSTQTPIMLFGFLYPSTLHLEMLTLMKR